MGGWAKTEVANASRHTAAIKDHRRVHRINRIFSSVASLAAAGTRRSFLVLFLTGVETLAQTGFAEERLPKDAHADKVIVLKSERTLELLDHNKVLKKYKVALGGNPVGRKERQGDYKTPEGLYILDRRNEHSRFYRSLHISHPNSQDRLWAKKSGAAPGGDIMLHGLPNGNGWIGNGHRLRDWTDGCVAVTNEEMDEIWRAVADGTPIEIRP